MAAPADGHLQQHVAGALKGSRVDLREAAKLITARGPRPFDGAAALRPLLRAEALLGSSASANAYALMLQFGIGGPKDAREAPEWYARAAADGNRSATDDAALAYALGWGVRRDNGRADDLLATLDADARARSMLRISDALMAPGREEPEEARRWAARAAALGTADQTRAALRYEKLGPVDAVAADKLRTWFGAGVERGEAAAMLGLARQLNGGSDEERARAATLMASAIAGGDGQAVSALVGLLEARRRGDPALAPVIATLEEMATRGVGGARSVLAQVYAVWGVSDPELRRRGRGHLEAAAEAGDAEAQYRLALVLLNPVDGSADLKAARAYLSLAAQSGHSLARDAVSQFGEMPLEEARSAVEAHAASHEAER